MNTSTLVLWVSAVTVVSSCGVYLFYRMLIDPPSRRSGGNEINATF